MLRFCDGENDMMKDNLDSYVQMEKRTIQIIHNISIKKIDKGKEKRKSDERKQQISSQ